MPLPHGTLVLPQSRASQVADLLAREIRGGHLEPGEKLPTEQELIGRFGVSRTVVREAMASLRSQGLVISRQGSGVFVAGPDENSVFRIAASEVRSLADVSDVLQLRLAVEVEAAGLAALHRTEDDLEAMEGHLQAIDAAIAAGEAAVQSDYSFHRAISTATGNPYFERFLHFLGPVIIPRQTVRPPSETPEQRRAYLAHVQEEHRRLLQAIARGSVEAARLSAREHLAASRDRYARLNRGMAES